MEMSDWEKQREWRLS